MLKLSGVIIFCQRDNRGIRYNNLPSVLPPKAEFHVRRAHNVMSHNLCNVFDPLVTAEHPELNYIKSLFHQYGAVGYQMTGSGSAVYAIVSEFEVAAVICNMLKANYSDVFICKPV